MDKQQAIAKLERQRGYIEALTKVSRRSPEFTKWYRDTRIACEYIFGKESSHVKEFTNIAFSLHAFSSSTPDSEFERAYQDGLIRANTLLCSIIEEIQEYGVEYSQELQQTAIERVEIICNRFHLITRQLRSRHENRKTIEVEDEYDAQDLFHALLYLYFDDIRKEEWVPIYAGGGSRIDFVLKQEQIVIELKKTRKGLTAKELGEQLLVDIQKYQAYPYCKILICFVYDPEGRIANPRGVENDLLELKKKMGIELKVFIKPMGL